MKLLDEIKRYIDNPYYYIENANIKNIIAIIKYAKFKYFNDIPIISDNLYDLLIDYIDKYGTDKQKLIIKEVGEKIVKKKHKLPFIMTSMNKIKLDNSSKLDNWINIFKGPYLISEKLDGVSAMIVYKNYKPYKLYTRGNGYEGQDISYLLKYLVNIPSNLSFDNIYIRGELIMSKESFEKYSSTMMNARNLVSGQVNAKKINISMIHDIDFVAYEIIEPWYDIKYQYELLKQKFNVPHYIIVKSISSTFLSNTLKDFKLNSIYNIDGIVINNIYNDKRYIDGNPEYSFAFKELIEDQIKVVKVIDVEWNVSKHGLIKPRLLLEPVMLSGVIVKYVTGFNAKYIKDNKIGKNSIIKITRSGDVIPHIIAIVKSTEPKFPDMTYKWNKSGVDIVITKGNYQQIIKLITSFLKNINVKYINEKIVEKLYNIGYKNIISYFSFDKNNLIGVEGFKETMINKIEYEITNAIMNMELIDLMVASNIFGYGFGKKKIKKILEVYPDIIMKNFTTSKNILIDKIKNINGFDKILSEQFVKNLDKFCDFFMKLPKTIRNKLLIETIIINIPFTKKENKYMNKSFIFSGFRNKKWEEIIEANGGFIKTSVPTKYNSSYYVITKDEQKKNPTNSKVLNAKNLNIIILSETEFIELFNIS